MLKKSAHFKKLIWLLSILQFVLVFITVYGYVDKANILYSMVGFVAVLFIPYLWLDKKGIYSFFYITTLYLAFIPSFNPDNLCELKVNLTDVFTPLFSTDHCMVVLSVYNKEPLIVALILLILTLQNKQKLSKWFYTLFLISALCFMGMLVLPLLWNILLYCFAYFLIIAIYVLMEKLLPLLNKTSEKIVFGLIIAVLFFRGLYQMLSILQMYPL